jgi:Flagellar basal body-associated protein FliL.
MTKIIIVAALVTVVVFTECFFAYLLIPSRSDLEKWATEKAAKTTQAGEHGEHGEHGSAGQAKKHSDHTEVEVDLGKYNVIVHQPTANVTLRVSFHLIGTLSEEEHTEFEHLLEKNQHRLRDQAIFEIRNCQIEDLTDPGLALLKRRILAKSNDLFGKPLLHSVVFSDFSFIEQ